MIYCSHKHSCATDGATTSSVTAYALPVSICAIQKVTPINLIRKPDTSVTPMLSYMPNVFIPHLSV